MMFEAFITWILLSQFSLRSIVFITPCDCCFSFEAFITWLLPRLPVIAPPPPRKSTFCSPPSSCWRCMCQIEQEHAKLSQKLGRPTRHREGEGGGEATAAIDEQVARVAHICLHVCRYACVYTRTYVHMYECICTCVCVRTYVTVRACVRARACVNVCVCVRASERAVLTDLQATPAAATRAPRAGANPTDSPVVW